MPKLLDHARSRAELIASFRVEDFGLPPVAAAEPEQPDSADDEVANAINAAIVAQEADPDITPADEKVLALLLEARAAQEGDTDNPAVTAAAVMPPNPIDAQGNVAADHPCARPDCGHFAESHMDTDGGANTGACGEIGCSCMAMQVASEGNEEAEPEAEAEAPKAKGAHAVQPVDAEPGMTPESAPEPDLNAPPEVDAGENVGPEFSGVLVIEGQRTGDGRAISVGALDWRSLPLPLMGLATAPHDPSGMSPNAPAVIAGMIETLSTATGEGDTQLVRVGGHFFANEDGAYFADLTEQMGRMGVSVDIAIEDSIITVETVDDDGFPMERSQEITMGTIMGGTVVPFPAFEGCYVVLGDGTNPAEAKAIPGRSDEESAEVNELPPALAAAHLMAYSECEACDEGVEVITAAGGPARPPAAWFADPQFAPDDGRLMEILGRHGRREGKYACPLTVTEDGRVFGHIAPWGVCHTGKPGCIVAPHSRVGYAHFKRGQHVVTAEGEKVGTGTLTADTGHAPLRVTPSAAMAHYDNTALQAADVNIGEDEYGIWVAGALRPGVTAAQVRNLTAGSLSGDWREIGGQLELVAALAVPLPGFPLVVVDHRQGDQRAITAAGAFVMHRLKHPADAEAMTLGQLAAAMEPLLPLAKERARDVIAGIR